MRRSPPEVDTETRYDETIDSVVTVYATGNGGSSSGSGFVYDEGSQLLTNHHIVEIRFGTRDE